MRHGRGRGKNKGVGGGRDLGLSQQENRVVIKETGGERRWRAASETSAVLEKMVEEAIGWEFGLGELGLGGS